MLKRRGASFALVLVVLAVLAAGCSRRSPDDRPSAARSLEASTTVPAPTTAPATTAATTTTTGRVVRITGIGDSYSAGVGATTPLVKIGDCWRDPAASISALTADRLRAAGHRVELDLRACDGGTIADILAKQLPGAAPSDALIVTFGGNDLGFRRLLTECLTTGCRSYDQPADRFPGFAHDAARTDWEVLTQRLVDGFEQLSGALAPGGAIYAVTYPIPFPAAADPACLEQRANLTPESRDLANAVIDRLGGAVVAAAALANERAGSPVVRVVEWRSALDAPLRTATDARGVTRQVRDNPDGICSAAPVLNGLVTTELSDSFHPTDRGHRVAAEALAAAITAR